MTGRVPKPVPSRRRTADAAKEQPAMSWRRHYGGFVLAGGSAFVTDAGVLQALIRYSPLGPFTARILAIAATVTPPDVMSQLILFVAVYPLYEISIFLIARFERQREAKARADGTWVDIDEDPV